MRCSVPLTLPSKSLEPSDYDDLQPAMRALHHTIGWARGHEYLVGLAHPHRLWEYGSAITAMTQHFEGSLVGHTVLDVGAGPGALGPALALHYNCAVTEADPSVNLAPLRAPLIEALRGRLKYGYTFDPSPLSAIPEGNVFHAVFSISVMEHLPAAEQEEAWTKLASLVAPGGVLAVTIDFGRSGEAWKHDTDREVKLGAEDVEKIAEWLRRSGITLTPIDTTYHGPQVFDYTFFRLIGHRAEAA